MSVLQLNCDNENGSVAISVGGVVSTKAASSTRAAQYLFSRVNREIGLLPPFARWISPMRRVVLIERPPGIQTVVYRNSKVGGLNDKVGEEIFNIPLGWTAQMIMVDDDYWPSSVAIYAMKGPITDNLSNKIGILPLPNIYESGFVCLPNRDMSIPTPTTIGESIELGYRLAWQGGFNQDAMEALLASAKTKQPTSIFSDLSGKLRPQDIYLGWEKLPVSDVMNIGDWARPRGFGTHVEKTDSQYSTLTEVIGIAEEEEKELFKGNPTLNYINSAVAHSY